MHEGFHKVHKQILDSYYPFFMFLTLMNKKDNHKVHEGFHKVHKQMLDSYYPFFMFLTLMNKRITTK